MGVYVVDSKIKIIERLSPVHITVIEHLYHLYKI